MSSSPPIQVDTVSKCFEIYSQPIDRLKQFFFSALCKLRLAKGKKFYQEFWAIRNVTFSIQKGETVAIIGRNGSGKSTLLQLICGTLNPTSGSIETNGRIAALLELGSGFNPEFSGKENVFLNAAVLGLTDSEIADRYDSIIEFADIGDHIAQPVKTYSSGMVVRLAFAVAAHVDADILVVDEALSVGDVFFQQKCMRYLSAFQQKGGTVLFVSHDTSAVLGLCEKAILLSREAGKEVRYGSAEGMCRIYLEELYSKKAQEELASTSNTDFSAPSLALVDSNSNGQVRHISRQPNERNLFKVSTFSSEGDSFGEGGVTIQRVFFADSNLNSIYDLVGGELVTLRIEALAKKDISRVAVGFMLKDRLGQYVYAEGTESAFIDHAVTLKSGDLIQVNFNFAMPILIQGDYSINVAVAEGSGHQHYQHHWIHDALTMQSLTSRLVHGISGLQSFSIDVTIKSNDSNLINKSRTQYDHN